MVRRMQTANRKLVLFDIDGTLLHVNRAGRSAFRETLLEDFGWDDDLSWLTFAGCTDRGILRRVFERWNHPAGEEDYQRFFRVYPGRMADIIEPTRCTVFPGVLELLEALSRRPEVLLGLVTGNIRQGAQIKLGVLGLDHFFAFGGFGDDHEHRNELARLAKERAEPYLSAGQQVADIYLFGDAPSDMEAAVSLGAVGVGVGTSLFSEDQLREAGAVHFFETLEETPSVLRALGLA